MEDSEKEYWFRSGLKTGYAAGFSDGKCAAIMAIGEIQPDTEKFLEMMKPSQEVAAPDSF